MNVPIFETPHTQGEHLEIIIAIPARIGSTRLARKPLALLAGQPLITHVAQRVSECKAEICRQLSLTPQAVRALVATDSEDVARAIEGSGMLSVMTSSELPSGTDRIHAAVCEFERQTRPIAPETLVINLQGDEPFFCVEDVIRLITTLHKEPQCPMGTLAFQQESGESFLRSSVVKVTKNALGNALYFSRAPIPWPRAAWGASEPMCDLADKMKQTTKVHFLQHIGIYAYRWATLKNFTAMPPGLLENEEGLEQLRALEAGWPIRVVEAQEAPFGIDTIEDLARAEKYLANQGRMER